MLIQSADFCKSFLQICAKFYVYLYIYTVNEYLSYIFGKIYIVKNKKECYNKADIKD